MTDGFFLPNRFVRTTINALQEVVGVGAMKTIYRQADLPDLGENPLPDTMNCEFSFVNFSRLIQFAQRSDGAPRWTISLHPGRPDMHEAKRTHLWHQSTFRQHAASDQHNGHIARASQPPFKFPEFGQRYAHPRL